MHIAVDLDGTLAEYHGFDPANPHHIGEPIPAMMDRVHTWLEEGHQVSIFTARVSEGGDESAFAAHQIRAWLKNYSLENLEVTATKQKKFTHFWDDRAIQVIRNEGCQVECATPCEQTPVVIEPEHKDTGSHYRYSYKGIKLDPARILTVYEQSHPMAGAIVKKALCAGNRGHKDLINDIDDIICAAVRWKEMIEEDKDE